MLCASTLSGAGKKRCGCMQMSGKVQKCAVQRGWFRHRAALGSWEAILVFLRVRESLWVGVCCFCMGTRARRSLDDQNSLSNQTAVSTLHSVQNISVCRNWKTKWCTSNTHVANDAGDLSRKRALKICGFWIDSIGAERAAEQWARWLIGVSARAKPLSGRWICWNRLRACPSFDLTIRYELARSRSQLSPKWDETRLPISGSTNVSLRGCWVSWKWSQLRTAWL